MFHLFHVVVANGHIGMVGYGRDLGIGDSVVFLLLNFETERKSDGERKEGKIGGLANF